MPKRRLLSLLVIVVCVFSLLAGCTININVGNSAENANEGTNNKNNRKAESPMYESCASIYIANATADANEVTAFSSSDLAVSKQLVDTYVVILQSKAIRDKIRKEYPDAEYTLSLECINETEVFKIIATGKSPEHLEEICNMAVSLFCEAIPQIMEGISCRIVEHAASAQKVWEN